MATARLLDEDVVLSGYHVPAEVSLACRTGVIFLCQFSGERGQARAKRGVWVTRCRLNWVLTTKEFSIQSSNYHLNTKAHCKRRPPNFCFEIPETLGLCQPIMNSTNYTNLQTTQSFIKDTTHFLNKLQQLGQLPNNAILVTLDVSSLYTNIPHNEGIDACRHFLDARNRTSSTISTETLCDLIRMILTMNNFTFHDRHYLQIHGPAMGTRMAPSYANLFLAKFETDALLRAPFQPYIWWRFIDDIFMIWTHSLDDLQTFTTYLNNIHPTIKFTSNHSFTSIPFLDVSVSLCNGTITTDLYTKPTDKHQYLLQSSCHPKHTKRAIPFSLALRLRHICSSDDTFTLRTNELKTYLNKRGYNLSFLNQEIGRVNDITRSDALTNKDTPDTDQPTRVPLVITYNAALRSVSSIIHKHFNILSSSPRCANVFKATPLVAFRRTNNLSNLLVSAKLPNPTHNTPPHGSFLCEDNCLTCNYITDGRTSFTFHSIGETRLQF